MQAFAAAEGVRFSDLFSKGALLEEAQIPFPIIVSGLFTSSRNLTNGTWEDQLVPWESSPLWTGSYHSRVKSFVKTR